MLIVLMFSFTACFDTQEKEKTQEDNDNGDDNGEMGGDDEAIYFNLYNNVWNTNFPMWYDECARFRFTLRLGLE